MKFFTKLLLNYLIKRATFHVMIGRYRYPDKPTLGRYVRSDIEPLLTNTYKYVNELTPEANLSQYISWGNRLNILFGVYSLATYRALRDSDITHERAIEIFGDILWQLYALGVNIPLFFIRPFTKNPQTRLNFVLRTFLIFPFAEDPIGYHRTFWKEKDRYCTDWHRCVVYDYFCNHGSEKEIELFRRTWCQYDYALPRLIHPDGFYERAHTISSGDNVCDMRWYGKKNNSQVSDKI